MQKLEEKEEVGGKLSVLYFAKAVVLSDRIAQSLYACYT